MGDSNFNARVERAIQELGGLVRTLKSALESRIGQKIPLDHVVAPWVIKHAASVITRYVVRDCGNTSYKLIKGRRCHEPTADFWGMVLFKPPLTGAEKAHKESWKDRWIDGVYFGTLIRTSENLIGTDKGVFKVNALRRRPLDERWCREEIDKAQGCPHKPVPRSESFRIPTFARPELQGHGNFEVRPREFVRQQDDLPQVRDLYVSKEEVMNHGPSPNCQRCRAVVAGKASTKPHTDECRTRFRELAKSSEAGRRKVKWAEERMVAVTYRRSNVMEQEDESEKKQLREAQDSDQTMATDDNGRQPGSAQQNVADDNGSRSQTASSSNAATTGSAPAPGAARGSKRSQAPPRRG